MYLFCSFMRFVYQANAPNRIVAQSIQYDRIPIDIYDQAITYKMELNKITTKKKNAHKKSPQVFITRGSSVKWVSGPSSKCVKLRPNINGKFHHKKLYLKTSNNEQILHVGVAYPKENCDKQSAAEIDLNSSISVSSGTLSLLARRL